MEASGQPPATDSSAVPAGAGNTPPPDPAPAQPNTQPDAPEPNVVDETAVPQAETKTDPDEPQAVTDRKAARFYCPGCGRGYEFPAECNGATAQAPHPPIQTVSTDELQGTSEHAHGDPEGHTAAPATEG